MKNFGKKQILVLSLAFLVCGAVYINWKVSLPETVETATENISNTDAQSAPSQDKILGQAVLVDNQNEQADDYFSKARLTRETARNETIEGLKALAEGENTDADTKNEIYNDIRNITLNIENEALIENTLMAKGYEECLAILSDGSASVVVKTENLTNEDALIIKDAVVSRSDVKSDKVVIIPFK